MRRFAVAALLLGGCAVTPPPPVTPNAVPMVAAVAETDPVDTAADAADDPAIWRNRRNPAASLVIGTDKQAGIHVYALSGKRLSFTPAARLNNVDLRDVGGRVIAVASDRADVGEAHVALFTLDTVAGKLVPMGRYPVGPGEAYGMCLWTRARDHALFGFVVMKDGRIDQVSIDTTGATPQVRTVRSIKVGTQAEGCVVDDRTGLLYVAEEDIGLWRFAADPAAPVTGMAVAKVDGTTLVADAEGLALAPKGRDGGYLVVSSQGDNAYTLYRLPGVTYAGRFRIGGGAIDGTSETDGIDLMLGDFGPGLRHGLMVAQDGDNAPETQNFKFVAWDKVRKALRLR
ncbi:3-phytase [Sphingomonas sp. Leaf22]|uniref:phytase n=1 Tax=Sphingomonas sp. Leaf22 TaxID=1735687 RepID=UPI0007012ECC|nr:phytase [Sphingomonas sp. Leaf22]KQM76176.1 3-phytase [Sphingomonas sp. Leaf22]